MNISDYFGKAVYSQEGKRLGKVKDVWDGGRARTSHVLVIGRRIANDVFVPATATEQKGDDLVVFRSWDVIRSGPPLSQDRGKSTADMRLLDAYYSRAG